MGTQSSVLAWRISWTEESLGHKESDMTEHAQDPSITPLDTWYPAILKYCINQYVMILFL